MDLANRYAVRIDHPTWEAIRESMSNRQDIELTPEASRRFQSLISQPGRLGSLLRRLHELRVLERIIPPMAHARGLVQFNEYHKYTVDEHSIRAVEAASNFVKDNSLLGNVYRSLKDKRLRQALSLAIDREKLRNALWLGKMPLADVPLVEELAERGALAPPLLRPRYLDDPATAPRLEQVDGPGPAPERAVEFPVGDGVPPVGEEGEPEAPVPGRSVGSAPASQQDLVPQCLQS